MRRLFLPWFLLLACLSGCIGRERLNRNCEWTHDATFTFDIQNRTHQQHLIEDVQAAEELAIRYADAQRGHRSGQFSGMDEYVQTREQCMATLFGFIATNHRMDPQQVRESVGRRPAGFDVAVLLSFAVLYGLVANGLVGGIFSRFPVDAPMPALVATTVMSSVVSAGGLMGLGLWAGAVEMIRFGDTHMSYRVDRMPWSQHSMGLFVSGVILFWGIALVRYRRLAHQAELYAVEENHRVPMLVAISVVALVMFGLFGVGPRGPRPPQ
jgi:hypothetical protein